MITHLEPDILECEVKWALESIKGTRSPLFRQGGVTVSLMTRLRARGIREASYIKGGCGRETLVRRDVLGILEMAFVVGHGVISLLGRE